MRFKYRTTTFILPVAIADGDDDDVPDTRLASVARRRLAAGCVLFV